MGGDKAGKSQTVPWLFLSLYLGCLHSDVGSKPDGAEAGKAVSVFTLPESFGTPTTQKGGLRCVH